MPTVLRVGPYQFGFYASDQDEPPHVHVRRERNQAKFWLEPAVRYESGRGFPDHELSVIAKLVAAHRPFLLEQWHEYFGS